MTQKRPGFGALLPAAFILSLAAGMATPTIVMAATGGDSNRGDVWLDNVGQPAGPGHEMDPHLRCTDINLWGANLGDASGTYIIDGWPPSGHMEQDYPPSGRATWHYSAGKKPQVISVIPVRTLIADAVANGDTPSHQGYHFKLQLSQDPQKHKTFWINCPAASTGGGTTPTPTPTPTPKPTPTPTPPPTTTTGSTGGPTTGSVSGTTTINEGAVSTGSAQAAGLAQTGSGVAFPMAALLLGFLILLGGVSSFARSLLMRR